MRWQLGGNLRPVRMVCEFDWRECPSAVFNYVWSEIVADVVDCLTIESMMWKIIAIIFVCTLLVHAIYSKTRWMDENSVNRKHLNIVGCKVQDLELKVNILTYKMQYGTWPLPRHVRRHEIEERLGNVKLTLNNSSDRNTWLKHMLLSPAENAACLPYAKIGPRSVRCLTKLINLETKYMSSRFHRDASPASNKIKSSESSSEKSLDRPEISKKIANVVETKATPPQTSDSVEIPSNESPDSSKNDENNCEIEPRATNFPERTKIYSRKQRSYDDNSNPAEKCSSLTKKSIETNFRSEQRCNSIQTIDDHRDRENSIAGRKNYSAINFDEYASKKCEFVDETPEERVNCSQETLQRVTRKLENLHSVLRIYGSGNSATNEQSSSSKELAESILRDLKTIGNFPIDSESDGKIVETVVKSVETNVEDNRGTNGKINDDVDSEQCRTDRNSSSGDDDETFFQIPVDDDVVPTKPKNSDEDVRTTEISVKNNYDERITTDDDDKDSTNFYRNFVLADTSRLNEKNLSSETSDDETTKLGLIDGTKVLPEPSSTSSRAELSKETDTDERSNGDLVREVVNLKKALLTQIEIDNERKKIAEIEKSNVRDFEKESDENLAKSTNYYQSKLLEIISEEQSASSSTEKTSRPIAIRVDESSAQSPSRKISPNNDENSIERSNENSATSKLGLVSESSEYFSLSNLGEKLTSEKTCDSTEIITADASTDLTSDETSDGNEISIVPNDDALEKNITDLVNRSVKNIRDYIEVFSKMQNDAILETKKALNDENSGVGFETLKNCSSEDSMMHFVNTVAMVNSVSEELPRELPEPALNSLVYLDDEITDDDSTKNSTDCGSNYDLKRRPGSTSLTEKNFPQSTKRPSLDDPNSRSTFESANSEVADDRSTTNDSEISTSERSCKQLVMDYSLDSDGDFPNGKLNETFNLMEFDEETEFGTKNDDRRTVDSPLTGRTVIGTTNDVVDYFGNEIANVERNPKSDDTEISTITEKNIVAEKLYEIVETTSREIFEKSEFGKNVESENVCSTDEKSRENVVVGSVENISETNTWICDKSETENSSKKNGDAEKNEVFEGTDLTMSDSLEESTDFGEITSARNEKFAELKNSVSNGIVKNPEKFDDDVVGMKKNCTSTETSGTYMDAESREFSNSSGISLNLEKIDSTSNSKKSARVSTSTPLRQRIAWTAPKRLSSLNDSTIVAANKIEKKKSTTENSKNARTKSGRARTTRSQSSEFNEPRAKSTNSRSAEKTVDSTNFSAARRKTDKKNVDPTERRSRSYATPRKNEPSPRNSEISRSTDLRSPNINFPDGANEKNSSEKFANREKSKISNSRSDQSGEKNIVDERSFDSEKSVKPTIVEKTWKKWEKSSCSENFVKSGVSSSFGGSSKSSVGRISSRSCIPILKNRARAKSPMRGPLTMSTGSWRDESFSSAPLENIRAEGNVESPRKTSSTIDDPPENLEIVEKNDVESSMKIPDSRTVIYVNILTDHENSATRVIDPKKFLEYLKDRELKIENVHDGQISTAETNVVGETSKGTEKNVETPENRNGGTKILTVVSSAVNEKISGERIRRCGKNSGLAGSWSLRVEQREIEVSAKPSVIDTSTSISDLPELSTNARANIGKFEIFGIPKELTKDEYIELLGALNSDPNLHQLRDMHKLCNKLGLGFHE